MLAKVVPYVSVALRIKSYENILLKNVVRNVSGVTKMSLESPPNPFNIKSQNLFKRFMIGMNVSREGYNSVKMPQTIYGEIPFS